MHSLELVITGGQTGADQAGWRAAKACGIKTGGWMPHAFMTENGPRPEFAEMYGAKEHTSKLYPPRTRLNAKWGHATIWLGSTSSRGFDCTRQACDQGKGAGPMIVVKEGESPADFVKRFDMLWGFARILNIAGNRESSAPGIGEWVERYMVEVFRAMGGS